MKRIVLGNVALALLGASLLGCQKEPPQAPPPNATDTPRGVGTSAGTTNDEPIDFTSGADLSGKLPPKIKAQVMADPMLANPANQVDVEARDKMVHLKGHVKNNDLKKRAGTIAQQTLKELKAPADIKVSNELLTR